MSDRSPTPTPAESTKSKLSPRPPPRSLPSTPSSVLRQARLPMISQSEAPPVLPNLDSKVSPLSEKPHKARPKNPVEQVLDLERPPLPSPREPSKCPLFCCFYAEFDIIVGPKICFQSPRHFMDHDIGISTEQIENILEDTFRDIQPTQKESSGSITDNEHSSNGTLGENKTSDHNKITQKDQEAMIKSKPPNPDEVSSSIFDSTSEYIITGNELAGKMICLSTHQIHIMTRPTVIVNERYERNSLLFCVGFVLRRAEDPRPFRPLLSKWAMALRSMEIESQFLTEPTLRPQVQPMLENLLVSLNSWRRECNLLLDTGNPLNLKLFRPPKAPALPVPDHRVPVLLRKDWQFQMYDWDLAINWVVLHIDGVKHARWISKKSEVDMEMVRACLRVLKHHGVISLVDMFFYSNRYECTERAGAMLAGKDPKLLQDAFDFVTKHRYLDYQSSLSDSNHSGTALNPGPLSHNERPFSPLQTFSSSFPPISNSTPGSARDGSSKEGPAEVHVASRFRRQQKKMKAALAELYCSCSRNISFGDLWILKTEESNSTTSLSQATRNGHSATVTEETSLQPLDGRTGRSLPEDQTLLNTCRSWSNARSDLASTSRDIKREPTKAPDLRSTIDWKEVFEYFDHRRFASFGVVHGLLRRVHRYPLAYDLEIPGGNEMQSNAVNTAFELPKPIISATPDVSHAGKNSSMLDHRGSAVSTRTKGETKDKDLNDMFSEIVSSMDGTRCDDELVCMFEKPLEALLDTVKRAGNKGVVSTYSISEKD